MRTTCAPQNVLSQLLRCSATLAAATCITLYTILLRLTSCHQVEYVSHSRRASHDSMLIHACVVQACSFLCVLRATKTARLTTA